MKKVLTYISLFVFGAALFSSCNLNESPKFNDKDAFVAFDKAAVSVKEEGKEVKIPVTLASLKGIATTISYEAVDGEGKSGAKNGVDYKLADEAGTLTFSAEARTQYITVNIIERDGVYTGDLKFSLKFKTTGDVVAGAENSCTITIIDHDHPLSALLGTYTATGNDANNGPATWEMEFFKDAKDDHMVWIMDINNQGSGWRGTDIVYYGIVDAELKTITIPFGQESEYVYSNGNAVVLRGLNSSGSGTESGNCVATIDQSGPKLTIDFGNDWGFWAYIPDAGTISAVFPGIKAVKN